MSDVHEPGRLRGALIGLAAAAAALATGELVSAAGGQGRTLVTAIGSEFIDRYAASLKDLAVRLFGTNDKDALIIGIVVMALIFGALLGVVGQRRPIIAAAGFGAFGLLGWWAYTTDPQGDGAVGLGASAAAVAAALAVLFGIPALTRPRRSEGGSTAHTSNGGAPTTRRAALAAGGVLALSGLGALLSRRLGGDGNIEEVRESTQLPDPVSPTSAPTASSAPATTTAGTSASVAETTTAATATASSASTASTTPGGSGFDVQGLTSYITPNADFYRIDTALQAPRVPVDGWELSITGMVDEPFTLSFDELVEMATTEETVTLSCVSNEIGGGLVGNAVWQGVPLATLLERAGIQDGATQIVGRSVDDFTAGFPTDVALDGRVAMVAVAMNGEPLPVEHGFPARLVVAGLYGYVSATKWLREIELTTWEDFDGYWVPRGWSKEGPIKTQSRIDVPRTNFDLPAGPQPIAGIAWSPPAGISKVEVRIDEGDWQEAEIANGSNDNTWVQWKLEWDAPQGDHTITVRATDGNGETQTEESAPPAPNGASGWHSRRVRVP